MSKYFEAVGNRAVAAEELTSAYCNMSCEYCYIPKVTGMANMHSEVVEYLKEPEKYIKLLKDTYGDILEHLAFWGTEPTLILQYMIPAIPRYMEEFPVLNEFSFSTNFMSHSHRVLEFIEAVNEIGKGLAASGDQRFDKKNRRFENNFHKINIKVQISLDGPHEITDVSRKAGATDHIIKNFKEYLEFLANTDLEYVTITSNFKPTIAIEHIRNMAADVNKLDTYFKFFNDLFGEYVDRIDKLQGKLQMGLPSSGTLMVPGKYTSEDGKMFAFYIDKVIEFTKHLSKSPRYKYYNGLLSEYSLRFENFMRGQVEGSPTSRTCSGGDSNYAIDTSKQVHICHRSFYMNDQRYLDAIKAENDVNNWDVSLFEDGKIDNIRKNYIVDIENDYERTRFLTVMRGFHDFSEFREAQIYSQVIWLSKTKQANPRYEHDHTFAQLFAKYMVYVFGCSIENALNTTSIHLTPLSMIRMFGNGAFEKLLDEYIARTPRTENEEDQ